MFFITNLNITVTPCSLLVWDRSFRVEIELTLVSTLTCNVIVVYLQYFTLFFFTPLPNGIVLDATRRSPVDVLGYLCFVRIYGRCGVESYLKDAAEAIISSTGETYEVRLRVRETGCLLLLGKLPTIMKTRETRALLVPQFVKLTRSSQPLGWRTKLCRIHSCLRGVIAP